MGARAVMVMRALIERNSGGTDRYGQPGPPIWETVAGEVPCRGWVAGARISIGSPMIYSVREPFSVFPRGTDIAPGDRVTISWRDETYLGPALVAAVIKRKDHLACPLRNVDAGLAG